MFRHTMRECKENVFNTTYNHVITTLISVTKFLVLWGHVFEFAIRADYFYNIDSYSILDLLVICNIRFMMNSYFI